MADNLIEKKDKAGKNMHNKALGKWGEDVACRYLIKNGYRVFVRNFRAKTGELDVVATQGKTLVFVEVKTRSNFSFGQPCEAVTGVKQTKIRNTAQVFLQLYRQYSDYDLRFDVIEIVKQDGKKLLRHLKGAF